MAMNIKSRRSIVASSLGLAAGAMLARPHVVADAIDKAFKRADPIFARIAG